MSYNQSEILEEGLVMLILIALILMEHYVLINCLMLNSQNLIWRLL